MKGHCTLGTVAFLLLSDRPTGYYPLGPLQARPCVATLRHPWLRTFPKGNNQRGYLPLQIVRCVSDPVVVPRLPGEVTPRKVL